MDRRHCSGRPQRYCGRNQREVTAPGVPELGALRQSMLARSLSERVAWAEASRSGGMVDGEWKSSEPGRIWPVDAAGCGVGRSSLRNRRRHHWRGAALSRGYLHLSRGQISIIVAAVLLGSVFSTLFAGLLADWMGRKPLMLLSGVAFSISVPIIALSQGFGPLFLGRLLQGMSGGLVGVVVPLYLAECLPAKVRGKGTGIFQWLLTLGIFMAALIGIYTSYHVMEIARTASAVRCLRRRTGRGGASSGCRCHRVCSSLLRGTLFRSRRGGCFNEAASMRHGRHWNARGRRTRRQSRWMRWSRLRRRVNAELPYKDSLLKRRYVIPFLLACVILICNTATGINSVIGFNVDILIQSGLSDVLAHWGYVLFTFMNFLMTVVGTAACRRRDASFCWSQELQGSLWHRLPWGLCFCGPRRHAMMRAMQCRGW